MRKGSGSGREGGEGVAQVCRRGFGTSVVCSAVNVDVGFGALWLVWVGWARLGCAGLGGYVGWVWTGWGRVGLGCAE